MHINSTVPAWPPQHVPAPTAASRPSDCILLIDTPALPAPAIPAHLLHPHMTPAPQPQATQLSTDILQPLRYNAAASPAPRTILAPVHLLHVFPTVLTVSAASVSTAPATLPNSLLTAPACLPPALAAAPATPPAPVHDVLSTSAPGSFAWQTPVACSPVRTAPVSTVVESLPHPPLPPPAGVPETVPAYTIEPNSHVKTELSSCTPAACKSWSFVPNNQISTATVYQSPGAYNPYLAPLYTATPSAPPSSHSSPASAAPTHYAVIEAKPGRARTHATLSAQAMAPPPCGHPTAPPTFMLPHQRSPETAK
ncbi:proline-rich protein 36-like [Schistocerca piceifrons]|uniref:proline-rich protein 36-like n=1 Tax=Schistocerca piceifrons TaxID=274613 RepID=UPI001F5E8BD8|nr:proline-rich protein 36-like [Schistocerca piceifrons]